MFYQQKGFCLILVFEYIAKIMNFYQNEKKKKNVPKTCKKFIS